MAENNVKSSASANMDGNTFNSLAGVFATRDKDLTEDPNNADPIAAAEGGYDDFLPAWALPKVQIMAIVTAWSTDDTGNKVIQKIPINDTIDALSSNMAKAVLSQFENLTLSRIHHYAQLGEFATILFKEKKLANILVHVQQRTFYAHKHVLCCHSEFFTQILMEHCVPPDMITDVTLKNVSSIYFQEFITFSYYGEINLNDKNIAPLLNMCNKLNASMMRARIHAFIVTHGELHPRLVKRILTSKDLTDRPLAIVEAISNFWMFSDDANSLGRISFNDIMEILSSDDLNVKSELDVFWAALMWVAYDIRARFSLVDTLMSNVRMTCMSSLELLDIARATSLVRLSKLCKQHLMAATWVCHAREMGLEDPLGLPVQKPRKLLTDGPLSVPSTEEFNMRYIQYKKLVGDVNIDQLANALNTRGRDRDMGVVFADEIGGDLEFVHIGESRIKEEENAPAPPEVIDQWQGSPDENQAPGIPTMSPVPATPKDKGVKSSSSNQSIPSGSGSSGSRAKRRNSLPTSTITPQPYPRKKEPPPKRK